MHKKKNRKIKKYQAGGFGLDMDWLEGITGQWNSILSNPFSVGNQDYLRNLIDTNNAVATRYNDTYSQIYGKDRHKTWSTEADNYYSGLMYDEALKNNPEKYSEKIIGFADYGPVNTWGDWDTLTPEQQREINDRNNKSGQYFYTGENAKDVYKRDRKLWSDIDDIKVDQNKQILESGAGLFSLKKSQEAYDTKKKFKPLANYSNHQGNIRMFRRGGPNTDYEAYNERHFGRRIGREEAMEIQRSLGFTGNQVDGLLGPMTRRAYEAGQNNSPSLEEKLKNALKTPEIDWEEQKAYYAQDLIQLKPQTSTVNLGDLTPNFSPRLSGDSKTVLGGVLKTRLDKTPESLTLSSGYRSEESLKQILEQRVNKNFNDPKYKPYLDEIKEILLRGSSRDDIQYPRKGGLAKIKKKLKELIPDDTELREEVYKQIKKTRQDFGGYESPHMSGDKVDVPVSYFVDELGLGEEEGKKAAKEYADGMAALGYNVLYEDRAGRYGVIDIQNRPAKKSTNEPEGFDNPFDLSTATQEKPNPLFQKIYDKVGKENFENYRQSVIQREAGNSDTPYQTIQMEGGPGRGAYQFEPDALVTAAKKAMMIDSDEGNKAVYQDIIDGHIQDATQLHPDLQDNLFAASHYVVDYNPETGKKSIRLNTELNNLSPESYGTVWKKVHHRGPGEIKPLDPSLTPRYPATEPLVQPVTQATTQPVTQVTRQRVAIPPLSAITLGQVTQSSVPDIPSSPLGVHEYPNQPVNVPTQDGSISMRGVTYPILAIPDNDSPTVMLPNEEHKFNNSKNVLEIPMEDTKKEWPKVSSVRTGKGHVKSPMAYNPFSLAFMAANKDKDSQKAMKEFLEANKKLEQYGVAVDFEGNIVENPNSTLYNRAIKTLEAEGEIKPNRDKSNAKKDKTNTGSGSEATNYAFSESPLVSLDKNNDKKGTQKSDKDSKEPYKGPVIENGVKNILKSDLSLREKVASINSLMNLRRMNAFGPNSHMGFNNAFKEPLITGVSAGYASGPIAGKIVGPVAAAASLGEEVYFGTSNVDAIALAAATLKGGKNIGRGMLRRLFGKKGAANKGAANKGAGNRWDDFLEKTIGGTGKKAAGKKAAGKKAAGKKGTGKKGTGNRWDDILEEVIGGTGKKGTGKKGTTVPRAAKPKIYRGIGRKVKDTQSAFDEILKGMNSKGHIDWSKVFGNIKGVKSSYGRPKTARVRPSSGATSPQRVSSFSRGGFTNPFSL